MKIGIDFSESSELRLKLFDISVTASCWFLCRFR